MMRKLLLLLLVLINGGVNGFASIDYTAYWQKANQFYEQKEYDSAAYYYEKITKAKPQEATVYYNLGNTYYRLNLIGPAVLNYERALRFDPGNKNIKDNLALTKGRINNRIQGLPEIFFVRWWHSLTHPNTAGSWASFSFVLFLIVIIIMLAKRYNKLEQLPPQLTIGLSALWVVSLLFSITSANNKANSRHAVVMQQDTPFMQSPGSNKPLSLVPEGTTVKWGSEKAGWVEVRLPDGRSGWIQKNMLTKI